MSNQEAGGQGGYEHPSPHDDARLEAKALKNGWAVPEDRRRKIIARQCDIAETGSDRDATRAFVALRAGDPEFLRTAPQGVQVTVNVSEDRLKKLSVKELEYLDELAGRLEADTIAARSDQESAGGEKPLPLPPAGVGGP